jgi:hypothetical protein
MCLLQIAKKAPDRKQLDTRDGMIALTPNPRRFQEILKVDNIRTFPPRAIRIV